MNVRICEVGPRDGLQNEPEHLSPRQRADFVDRLSATGVDSIEIASFVNPARVPQMAGAEEVCAAVRPAEGVGLAALVLNGRGYTRLAETRCVEARMAFCVTETFNERNQGRSVEQSIAEAADIVAAAHADGRRAAVTLAASFGCPFEGAVDPGRVLAIAERVAATGADELVFADTIGVGVPRQVTRLLTGAAGLGIPLGLHLHNTRNTGYANAYAGVEAGVSVLDSSVAGIGGCPFAPKATGNIATEDLVYLLEGQGVDTGIDLDALLSTAAWITEVLGRPLPGQLLRAGRFPAPAR
ncbi:MULTISPECIES: hydroxymethylglutaryl-CoA lyase [unclassified Streptomyces]|uniref:hydroxymethylglutaryl-CoA lyase n=1 Tax=unclassified Streptomyces TaxID=2593676 RepID=UPI00224F52D7|nr:MULTISPECIES: hydroxymethylglutaryl-CoA lyase [unclassified Streptomyces]MCX4987189.1 hydroxymethylglutaryl-CoA lyase [Streptomyces sp. NBC_00568]MCX5007679.1 hydroxymethylglutaryl-CoA lyase [Streptomyces sp. NBC_00638]